MGCRGCGNFNVTVEMTQMMSGKSVVGVVWAGMMVISGAGSAAAHPGAAQILKLIESKETAPRARMLASMMACYPNDLPPDVRAQLEEETALLHPLLTEEGMRFWTDIQVWEGDGNQGPNLRAQPAHLTYSFPPDGATWGGFGDRPVGDNELNAYLMDTFGANDLDEGREYIRQALASYRVHSGLTYEEVFDWGFSMTNSIVPSIFHGDIRIGGFDQPSETYIAYNGFPSGLGIVSNGGGDMCINTIYFTETNMQNPENNYRWMRNVIAHEHGHGVGIIHSIPCNGTKLMEPFINTDFDILQTDDRRAIHRSYGDRFAGNHFSSDAHDLGTMDTRGFPRSVTLRHLSLNGVSGFGNTDEDWFKFRLESARDVVIDVGPVGGSYSAGQQSNSCSGTEQSISAVGAGNLWLGLYQANGFTLHVPLENDTSNGGSERITVNNLAAGTYFIRVRDVGPNSSTNQVVQLYTLELIVDEQDTPPTAIAGLNKRVQAEKNAWFMGDLNSYSNGGFFNFIVQYDWDLDGNGSFEYIDSPAKRAIQYVSNGLYEVSLRVHDLQGLSDTDTITVRVTGATTRVTGCSPGTGYQGNTVPVTITGTNLKNVTAAHVSAGTGITVVGTAVPNAMGTQVTGLSFQIAPDAPLTFRSVAVSNNDGSGSGSLLFRVLAPPVCLGDANNDGMVSFPDITSILLHWGSSYPLPSNGLGDANQDGAVNFSDITNVLLLFGQPCP